MSFHIPATLLSAGFVAAIDSGGGETECGALENVVEYVEPLCP